jgi:hypothetical protein
MASLFPPEKFITCYVLMVRLGSKKVWLRSLFGIDGHISVERIGLRELLKRVRSHIINMPKANAKNRLVCIFKGDIETL